MTGRRALAARALATRFIGALLAAGFLTLLAYEAVGQTFTARAAIRASTSATESEKQLRAVSSSRITILQGEVSALQSTAAVNAGRIEELLTAQRALVGQLRALGVVPIVTAERSPDAPTPGPTRPVPRPTTVVSARPSPTPTSGIDRPLPSPPTPAPVSTSPVPAPVVAPPPAPVTSPVPSLARSVCVLVICLGGNR